MKKGLLVSTVLFTALIGLSSLHAATTHPIKIKSENDAKKQLASDGTNILNTINTSKSDLQNGKVAIDIIIDNSKPVEVMYVIDNGTGISSVINNVIDTLKTNAKQLETRNNVKQGVVSTTNGETSLVPLDSANIENALNNIKTSTNSTTEGEIFASLDKAVTEFKNENATKVVILVVNNLGTLSAEDVTNLKAKIANYIGQGIQIVAYNIDMADKTNFNTIFEGIKAKADVVSTDLTYLNSTAVISTLLPSAKDNIVTKVSFDSYITNNFDIVEVTATKGTASYDANTKLVTWTAGTIESNEVVTLSYYLKIKDVVDSNVIESLTLRTNRQIVVTQNGNEIGTYPSNERIDDQVCSPTIIILKETVVNPQTGIAEYIIAGACMLSVALVTLVIMQSKNEFNRI